MNTVKNRIGREHQDKRLRVEVLGGEIAEIKLLLISGCDQHQECNGIVYDIISTNPSDHIKNGTAYWSEVVYVKSFEVHGG